MTRRTYYQPYPDETSYARNGADNRGSGCGCRGCFTTLILILALVLCAGAALIALAPTVYRSEVLILGLDRRPGESGPARSDAIMLAAFYPATPRIVLLSIPRDLWVSIPGRGEGRINTAYFYGETDGKGSGAALALATIRHNFGLPVNKYLVLEFQAFERIVDAAGGVEIEVSQTIIDPAYPTDDGGTEQLVINAGRQHLEGTLALKYVRTRHGDSDFSRMKRQQQVIQALIERLVQPRHWYRAPLVVLTAYQAVSTNLSPLDMLLMGITLAFGSTESIEVHQLDRSLVTPYVTATGAQVLLPRWEAIHPKMSEVFNGR